MTAAPAPHPNERGGYDPNGAAAKAGLNSSLLGRSLGLIRELTKYKAAQAGKTIASVPAAYSSQTCHKCGHVSPLNRPSQAEFICQACGASHNADHNAALVIAQRGFVLSFPLSGTDSYRLWSGPRARVEAGSPHRQVAGSSR